MTAFDPHQIARAVRSACVQAALDGYERAQIAGLCQEGAWECAMDARPQRDSPGGGRSAVFRIFFCLSCLFLSSLANTKSPWSTQSFIPKPQGRSLTLEYRSSV